MKIVKVFLIIWGKFSEPELEPDKNGPAPQHCPLLYSRSSILERSGIDKCCGAGAARSYRYIILVEPEP
jgi:hypothetical protein